MSFSLQPGQLTGLRCPSPQCRHAEVWVTTTRDWERLGLVLVHCRNGHVLHWYPDAGSAAEVYVPARGR
jgi:hypothetical protein